MKEPFTSHHTARETRGGYAFVFFCDICHSPVYARIRMTENMCKHTAWAKAQAYGRAVDLARLHFNRCQRCFRWVCDRDYALEQGICVQCAEVWQNDQKGGATGGGRSPPCGAPSDGMSPR